MSRSLLRDNMSRSCAPDLEYSIKGASTAARYALDIYIKTFDQTLATGLGTEGKQRLQISIPGLLYILATEFSTPKIRERAHAQGD